MSRNKTVATAPAKRRPKRQMDFLLADLVTRVRMATPLAREIVTLGPAEWPLNENIALADHIEELIGHHGPELGDDDFLCLLQSQATAYALGIAIGLLLRSDAFIGGTAKGAR